MNLPSSPLLLVLVVSIAVILFYVRRSLRYLQFFQQEEYNSGRFVNWWFEKRAFDTRGSLVALVVGGLGLAIAENSLVTLGLCIVGGLVLIAASWTEEDPRKVGKIKLNMTDRLTAIYQLSIGLYAAVVLGILMVSIGDSDSKRAPVVDVGQCCSVAKRKQEAAGFLIRSQRDFG
jgi:UDP-N-acetylmuramoyl-tripeptide--D-alanyl-D-alanine ligase